MTTQGRTHLSDPRTRAMIAAIVGLLAVFTALCAAIVVWTTPIFAFAAILLGTMAFAMAVYSLQVTTVVRLKRLSARRPVDRASARRWVEAHVALARVRPANKVFWHIALYAALEQGELALVRAIADEWLARAPRDGGRTNAASTTLTALAFDAFALVAMGAPSEAAAQLARFEALAREEPRACYESLDARTVVELSRAWIHGRDGETREARAIVLRWQDTIGLLPPAVVRVARALLGERDAEHDPDAPHYRALSKSDERAPWVQRKHETLEVSYAPKRLLASIPALAPRRGLAPLPLPPPHPRAPDEHRRRDARWAITASALLSLLAVAALASGQYQAALAAIAGLAMAVLIGLWPGSRRARAATPDEFARLYDAARREHEDPEGARGTFESLVRQPTGELAARAALHLAGIEARDGDGPRALAWVEHALATLHDETALSNDIAPLRWSAAGARAQLLAAVGRHEDAERALCVLARGDERTAWTAAVLRLTCAAQRDDSAGARALLRELDEDQLSEDGRLLRDALYAREDAALAEDVRARIRAWPAGLRLLRVSAPALAAEHAPSTRESSERSIADEADERSDSIEWQGASAADEQRRR